MDYLDGSSQFINKNIFSFNSLLLKNFYRKTPMKTGKKVLIVEDEFIISMDIEDMLISLGYTPKNKVLTGKSAIEKINSFKPDMALLDIRLKDNISGFDVANVCKEKKIPFAFITASTNETTLKKAEKMKPVDIISKPITYNKLKKVMDKVFGSK